MSRKQNKKRKKKKGLSGSIIFTLFIFLLFLVMMSAILLFYKKSPVSSVQDVVKSASSVVSSVVASEPAEPSVLGAEDLTSSDLAMVNYEEEEKKVYSFMQGPKAWEEEKDWSGAWCEDTLDGNRFSVFGCGMCCMANIYSTLSPYECSPEDMYTYAKRVSGYAPTPGTGAIGWGALKTTLKKSGFDCEVYKKNKKYKNFQKKIAGAKAAIVLVTSEEDKSYWKDTAGHYVTIWLYDSSDDTVFLCEPGSPKKNRQRIPLKYVYKALKTQSAHQYLLINSYDEDQNEWKHNGIDIDWNKPDYYEKKTGE